MDEAKLYSLFVLMIVNAIIFIVHAIILLLKHKAYQSKITSSCRLYVLFELVLFLFKSIVTIIWCFTIAVILSKRFSNRSLLILRLVTLRIYIRICARVNELPGNVFCVYVEISNIYMYSLCYLHKKVLLPFRSYPSFFLQINITQL